MNNKYKLNKKFISILKNKNKEIKFKKVTQYKRPIYYIIN